MPRWPCWRRLPVLTLVVPNFTTSTPGPTFTRSQLIFAGLVSLVLYGSFVFVQTVRHRDYFLPLEAGSDDVHAPPPSNTVALSAPALLGVALIGIVGLAKSLTPALETIIACARRTQGRRRSSPSPRWCCCPKASRRCVRLSANRLQTSLNLALGSALASIGLTIPAVAVVSILLGQPLALGLGVKDMVLLALTLLVGVITLGTGRTTVLQGIARHLVIFATFCSLPCVPQRVEHAEHRGGCRGASSAAAACRAAPQWHGYDHGEGAIQLSNAQATRDIPAAEPSKEARAKVGQRR